MKKWENEGYNMYTLGMPWKCPLRMYERNNLITFASKGNPNKILVSFRRARPQVYRFKRTPEGNTSIKNVTNYPSMTDKFIYTAIRINSNDEHSKLRGRHGEQKIRYEAGFSSVVKFMWEKCNEYGYEIPKVNFKNTTVGEMVLLAKYPIVGQLFKNQITSRYEGRGGRRHYSYQKKVYDFPKLFCEPLRKSEQFEELVYRICLSKNPKMRKYIGRYASEEKFSLIWLAYCLRGLVPIEYLYDIYDTCDQYGAVEQDLSERLHPMDARHEIVAYRKLLKNYTPRRILKFIKEGKFWMHLKDTTRQWIEHADKIILPEKPKSFKELHDEVSRQYRLVKTAYQKIKKTKFMEHLDGKEVDDFRIKVAESNHELIEWGEQMHNCIASYANRKDCILLGIFKENTLIYNIEIKNGKIKQFYGKRNSAPVSSDKAKLSEFIETEINQIPVALDAPEGSMV